MKSKDYLLTLIIPSALLLIPLAGSLTVEGWNWTVSDFVVAWVIFALTTLLFRFLVTRPGANLPYKIGAGLGILGGFLITWITLAVQIIGDDNPGNVLYLLTVLGGLLGVVATQAKPAGLSWVAFTMAAVLVIIPLVATILWPADFNPGYAKVQLLSACFAAMFGTAGLCFRRAPRWPAAA